MKTWFGIFAAGLLLLGMANGQTDKEGRYLGFQIFTYGANPKNASMGEGKDAVAKFPERGVLRDYIEDIKGRIGTVGKPLTRLAVVLGPISFDHEDAEVTRFIAMAFGLALETDIAVGFHIDDSMFWGQRKDLVSDRNNVETIDWDGTPCTGRRLDWGLTPSRAAPQMCFNSKAVQNEVRRRSALIGKAIHAGVEELRQRKRPELFAGVIAGWETMLGQDFATGQRTGYRALVNRGFTREHPPADLDLEREKVVQEFIEHWTTGLAEAGVAPQKTYSHTAVPGWVAFGKDHRAGFSTYPKPGLFEDIYNELAKHQQAGWASSEGTNMQPGTGPGQTGMNMETYLAKMFNHGAALVNVYSWGIGGEANKSLGFRVVTESEEALGAYRKFLKGEPLVEAKTESSYMDRLPPKIQRIQRELPAWLEKGGNQEKAAALMQQLKENLGARNFEEAEKTADSILKMMADRP